MKLIYYFFFLEKELIYYPKAYLRPLLLEKGFSPNLPNFFLYWYFDVNFENLNVKLHVFIMSFMLAKFQED